MKKLSLVLIFLLLGVPPLSSTLADNDTDYQWDRRDNVINPFQLFQNAFLWVLSNFWVVIIGFLGIGVLITILKKMK